MPQPPMCQHKLSHRCPHYKSISKCPIFHGILQKYNNFETKWASVYFNHKSTRQSWLPLAQNTHIGIIHYIYNIHLWHSYLVGFYSLLINVTHIAGATVTNQDLAQHKTFQQPGQHWPREGLGVITGVRVIVTRSQRRRLFNHHPSSRVWDQPSHVVLRENILIMTVNHRQICRRISFRQFCGLCSCHSNNVIL